MHTHFSPSSLPCSFSYTNTVWKWWLLLFLKLEISKTTLCAPLRSLCGSRWFHFWLVSCGWQLCCTWRWHKVPKNLGRAVHGYSLSISPISGWRAPTRIATRCCGWRGCFIGQALCLECHYPSSAKKLWTWISHIGRLPGCHGRVVGTSQFFCFYCLLDSSTIPLAPSGSNGIQGWFQS